MAILEKLREALSPKARRLNRLAEIAGDNEALVARLKRHAAACPYPGMRTEVEKLAAKEEVHLRALMTTLGAHNRWPRPPEEPARNGSNNWERLSGDLGILMRIAVGLARAATQWEALDSAVARRLAELQAEDEESVSELRRVALRCDPQAFD